MGNLGMRKGLAQPTGQHCVAAPEVRARTVLSENLIILIKGCFLPEEASFICLSTVTQQSHLQYVNFLFIIKCSKHEEQALYKQALQLGRQTAKQYCACSLPTTPTCTLYMALNLQTVVLSQQPQLCAPRSPRRHSITHVMKRVNET